MQKISQIVKYETARYQDKGVKNLILGVAMGAAFFVGAPIFGKAFLAEPLEQIFSTHLNSEYTAKVNFTIFATLFHIFVTLGCAALFYPLYSGKVTFFEKWRINKISDWEWNKPDWQDLKKRGIQTYLLNHLVLLPGFLIVDLFLRGNTISFRPEAASFPTLWEFFSQIVTCIFIDDTVFYWIHYIVHIPLLYKYIHKKHHSMKNPFSLAGEFDSIPEYYLAGTLPPLIAFTYLGNRTHMYTYWCYVLLKLVKQVDQHCGYEFPFSVYHVLPFTGSGISHTFHHTHNEGAIGNFFFFWDHIMGTDTEFIKYFNNYLKKKSLGTHNVSKQDAALNKEISSQKAKAE